ncbi:glutathione peroxidase [Phocaeicola dorei DSM 17855]|uniref:Glutathione peroxidase n=7 Tax=Phocaeicola TaxID=909656 RepID=B6VZ21_9BACT|nr:glutathione peroxidase [Phocaeicola dorei DSM 17855]
MFAHKYLLFFFRRTKITIFSRQSFLSEKTFQVHELFYYKIAFQMKTFILSIIVTMITSVAGAQQKSFYDFTVKAIDGKDLPLSTFKGKKVLVVNVASKCGFTPQYAKLEELYEKYGKDDFVVIGFPANNFLHQEPGTNEEIKEFCTLNYGVTFPMMAKISVKGKDIAPLYQWLTHKSENGVSDAKIGWNFHKFLIDENGRWVASIGSTTSPLSQEIVEWIEE